MNITKPGYMTSEFWLAFVPWILCAIVLTLSAFGQLDKDIVLLVLASLGIGGGLSSLGYANNRAVVKKANVLTEFEE